MPILTKDDLTILYVHVPKTGGSTIERFFAANGFRVSLLQTKWTPIRSVEKCPVQHYHAALLRALLRIGRFDYVFMTVRHPYDRLVSEYKMQARQRRSMPPFEAWVDRTFRRYAQDPYIYDNHIRPQSAFVLKRADVFRQEDRYDAAWAGRIAERIGVPLEAPVVDANVAGEPDPPAVGPDTWAAITAFYEADFATFGYEAAPPRSRREGARL